MAWNQVELLGSHLDDQQRERLFAEIRCVGPGIGGMWLVGCRRQTARHAPSCCTPAASQHGPASSSAWRNPAL